MSVYATELELTDEFGDDLRINRNVVDQTDRVLEFFSLNNNTGWGLRVDEDMATQLRDYLDEWLNDASHTA